MLEELLIQGLEAVSGLGPGKQNCGNEPGITYQQSVRCHMAFTPTPVGKSEKRTGGGPAVRLPIPSGAVGYRYRPSPRNGSYLRPALRPLVIVPKFDPAGGTAKVEESNLDLTVMTPKYDIRTYSRSERQWYWS